VTSQALYFCAKTELVEKIHRLKWGKNTKFGFLRSFVCLDENIFCTTVNVDRLCEEKIEVKRCYTKCKGR